MKTAHDVARAALDYIDALPADVVARLPAMPGFDRDDAENILLGARAERQPVAVKIPGHITKISDAILDNILANDDEFPMANAARLLVNEVRFWRSVPLYAAPPAPVVPDTWVLCSQRMPNKGERVLAFIDFDSSTVPPLVKDAEYTGSTFRVGPNTVNVAGESRVTHWQPLPIAPQEIK